VELPPEVLVGRSHWCLERLEQNCFRRNASAAPPNRFMINFPNPNLEACHGNFWQGLLFWLQPNKRGPHLSLNFGKLVKLFYWTGPEHLEVQDFLAILFLWLLRHRLQLCLNALVTLWLMDKRRFNGQITIVSQFVSLDLLWYCLRWKIVLNVCKGESKSSGSSQILRANGRS
jgi:hypothetical protein